MRPAQLIGAFAVLLVAGVGLATGFRRDARIGALSPVLAAHTKAEPSPSASLLPPGRSSSPAGTRAAAQEQHFELAGLEPHTEAPRERTNEELVRDLRDDDVRGNAMNARREIWRRRSGRDDYAELTALLDAALTSSDVQQRLLAASLLQRLSANGPGSAQRYRPTQRLIDVTLEGMYGDTPRDGGIRWCIAPLNSGIRFLLREADLAAPTLERELLSVDEERRFLAAFVLAYSGHERLTPRLAPHLIPRLADNRIAQDGLMSLSALYRCGPGVVPHLVASDPGDDQQRRCLELLRLELWAPPTTAEEEARRRELHELTHQHDHPLRTYRFGWYASMRR